MKKFIKINKIIWLFVITPLFFACEDDDTATTEKAVAGFVHTINQDNGMVTFLNLSENANSYSWDFGDGTSSTLINPEKIYENGTYTVVLESSNASGSSDTFQDEITILIPEIIAIPISFDGENTNYDAATFGGTSFAVVENPDPSGSNTDVNNVGAITNNGATFEGIAFELGEPIDLSTERTIKMDFWSDQALSILLKLEVSESEFTEVTVSHGGTGWEELSFNFSASGTYPKLVIFVDGPGTATGTFYFDNVVQEETPIPPCEEPETEQSLNASDLNLTFFSDPGTTDTKGSESGKFFQDNVTYEYVDNPDGTTDVNKSCKVGKVTKSGVQPWDNLQIDFDDKFTFADGDNFTIKVYSPVAGYNVSIKLEDKLDGGIAQEVASTTQTTKTNEWEELTIPFGAGDTGKFDRLVIFFDVAGAANTNAYYIDDLKLNRGSGGGGGDCVPETMQSINSSDIDLTFMSDPGTTDTKGSESGKFFQDNVTYEYVDNPDFSTAANNSCKVGKVTKAGVESWDNLQIDFDEKFTFADGDNFTIKVYSPVSGYNVSIKLEDKLDGGIAKEVASTTQTTKTEEWEELTIPFGAGDSGIYDRLVIFFDVAGAANTNTYYIDDLKLNRGSGGGGGDCPVPPAGEFITDGDFEANADCWELFDNGGTTIISTSVSNGGGTNSGQITSASGANPGLKQTRFGVGTIQPNTTYEVTFDIQANSPLVDGAVFQAFTFSEPADGSGIAAVQHVLIAGDPNVTASWVTRTYEFTTAANVDGGVSLLFELVCGGAATCGGTINIDNVSMTAK